MGISVGGRFWYGFCLYYVLVSQKESWKAKSDLNVFVEASNGKRPSLLPCLLTGDDCSLLLGNNSSWYILLHPSAVQRCLCVP